MDQQKMTTERILCIAKEKARNLIIESERQLCMFNAEPIKKVIK